MPWNSIYLTKIKEITKLIEEGDASDALAKFKQYLETLQIGKYATSSVEWNPAWRSSVYDFGKIFSSHDAGPFIETIENHLRVRTITNDEEVCFIYSEILWNFFGGSSEYVGNILKSYKNKYPTNPEFHHSYSHYLENNSNLDAACKEAYIACKIDKKNTTYQTTFFNKCRQNFNSHLRKKDTEKAKEILDSLSKDMKELNIAASEFINITVLMRDRLDDHEIIEKKFTALVNQHLKSSQKKKIN